MSQKVSPFMGGLGRDVTSKFEIQSNATVTVGDGTNGGNVAVGDNGVISFGAGSDLQIYHTGTDSRIVDAGTGNFTVQATNFVVNNSADTQNMIIANDGAAVSLYYGGSSRLATTATGVNVTGDVQGDGLIIDGTFDLGTL